MTEQDINVENLFLDDEEAQEVDEVEDEVEALPEDDADVEVIEEESITEPDTDFPSVISADYAKRIAAKTTAKWALNSLAETVGSYVQESNRKEILLDQINSLNKDILSAIQ